VVDRLTIVFRALVPGATLVPTGFGTFGPGQDAETLEPQIMLMPLAAFDAAGNRIGYGAGHYDRAIARLRENGRNPRLVGCAFSVQEVDLVPADPHDIRMHAVLTENGYRAF
jgi:5-formyltetrahydrofolate cyclo-ligase